MPWKKAELPQLERVPSSAPLFSCFEQVNRNLFYFDIIIYGNLYKLSPVYKIIAYKTQSYKKRSIII